MSGKPLVFYDAEIYRNWYCFNFRYGKQLYSFEALRSQPIPKSCLAPFITEATLCGFNNKNYDDIMLILAYNQEPPDKLYEISQMIIVEQVKPYEIIRTEKLNVRHQDSPYTYNDLDTIDIMNVLVGKAGLKLYGSRAHYPRLQELPIAYDKVTTYEDQRILVNYCHNDTGVTEYLHNLLAGDIKLREEMSAQYGGVDLRSKSAPQIAEILLVKMCEQSSGIKIYKPQIGTDIPLEMAYDKPGWIGFQTKKFQKLLTEIEYDIFRLNPKTGHLILGGSVTDRIVRARDCSLKMGIGGLHAVTNPGARYADEEYCIVESDFASLYPNMIVNSGSYPTHFGKDFFTTYKYILSSRMEDKHAGRMVESDAKKLILNSSFGQFSSKYSKLYSPNLLLNTTLSGQLTLLMLIELLELHGFFIFTANTDSVTLRIKRVDLDRYKALCSEFENYTNLTLEHDFYKTYITQNVNSYFAIYE